MKVDQQTLQPTLNSGKHVETQSVQAPSYGAARNYGRGNFD